LLLLWMTAAGASCGSMIDAAETSEVDRAVKLLLGTF
jgi:hypothetical protein